MRVKRGLPLRKAARTMRNFVMTNGNYGCRGIARRCAAPHPRPTDVKGPAIPSPSPACHPR
ncbi:hypothetical protein LG3211_0056 [Lysobacter gummosus]|nr:hypothetical protein LG3211_0056 [Lysobacter gummosus]